MKLDQMAIAALIALSATTILGAPPAADRRGDALAAETRVERLASETKGGPQQRLLLAKEKIRRLIDDLDAGKSVDPSDFDQALQNAARAL
jgi:hypothetical protein